MLAIARLSIMRKSLPRTMTLLLLQRARWSLPRQ
jgi:hypothetical protein